MSQLKEDEWPDDDEPTTTETERLKDEAPRDPGSAAYAPQRPEDPRDNDTHDAGRG